MPNQADLDKAEKDVKNAIAAAADRVIAKLANPVSQDTIDALVADKAAADQIAAD